MANLQFTKDFGGKEKAVGHPKRGKSKFLFLGTKSAPSNW